MELFETSGVWLIALGKTLIHSIWIGMAILGLLRLFLNYIPSGLSALRYGIAVFTLLFLFMLVLGTFILIYRPLTPVLEMHVFQGSYRYGRIFGSISFFRLFGYVYFAGVLIMLFRSFASLAYVRGLRKSGIQLPHGWNLRFMEISKSLGIKRSMDFFESTLVNAPLLVGYLRPAVIIPAGMLTNLPVSQIEIILLHELYHLKRKDYLVNIMQLFIEAVLFYHPVVWIISGYVRSEREHCCDDCVLKQTNRHIFYAKALIHLAEQQHYSRLAPGAVGSGKKQFESRIKRILNYNTMKTNMRDKILSLTLLAGSLIMLLIVSGFSTGPSFIRTQRAISELAPELAYPVELLKPDTIPQEEKATELREVKEPQEPHEFEWEDMKKEIEEARREALEEIEEIDWEAMKEEMEEARLEALKEIEEIDWEAMKEEMEEVRLEALKEIEEIDWEDMKEEMEESFSEMKIDMEIMKTEIKNLMGNIEWDKIREDLENSRVFKDSIKIEMDR